MTTDAQTTETLVSVIVPIYNTEKYLAACVDSIRSQTHRNLEVILVDDGSNDSSPQFCDRFAEQDSRVSVIHQENRGVSCARNRGMELARGEYVYFLDSDDFIAEDSLEKLVAKADEDDLDVIIFDGRIVTADGDLDPARRGLMRTGVYQGIYDGKSLFTDMMRNREYSVHVQCHFIRRAALQESGLRFIEGVLHEDDLFIFQLLMQSGRCGHLPEPFFYRRIRSGSVMTTAPNVEKVTGYVCTLEHMADYFLNNQFEKDVEAMIRYNMTYLFWAAYDRYLALYGPKRRQRIAEGADVSGNSLLKKRLFCCMKKLGWLDDGRIARRCRYDGWYLLVAHLSDSKRRVFKRVAKLKTSS